MTAWWMVGLADRPERSAEIWVFWAVGRAGRSVAVGMGPTPVRHPAATEDFEAVRLPIDVAEFHDYAVAWTPGSEQVE